MLQGKYSEAIDLLLSTYKYRKLEGTSNRASQTLSYIIEYALKYKSAQEAFKIFKPEKDYFDAIENVSPKHIKIYLFLSNMYSQLNKPVEAADYLAKYNSAKIKQLESQQIFADDRINLNQYISLRNEIFERELEMTKLSASNLSSKLRLRNFTIVFITFLFLFIGVLATILHRHRIQKKKRDVLLVENERKIIALENENLKQDVELKRQDLIRIAEDNKIRTSIKKEILRRLKRIENLDDKKLHKELLLLTHELDSAIDNQSQLSLMQDNIDKINAEFENKLRKLLPKISINQVKLCSLIKIGMDNQQIAQMLNRSDSTIRTNKSRLREKLKLKSVKELEQFIQNL
jgi:DNA-binding CsgD family transcriptional regulator